MTSKAERRAKDRAALKCWCGNVAGMGQTLCGAHREEPRANLKRARIMNMLDTLEIHSPDWIGQIRTYILELERER